jgi:hypothetical protein
VGVAAGAILGDGGRLAYTEATGEFVSVVGGRIETVPPDAADVDAWYRAMPGLGRWVTEESMRTLFDELGPDLFARECLCVWDPEPVEQVERVISAEQWAACLDARSQTAGDVAFAIDVTPDHKWAAIGVAGFRSDGLPHVEVVAHRAGTDWLVARAAS